MDSRNEGGHVSFWRRSPRIDGNVATRRPTILKSIATDLLTNTPSDLPVSEAAQDKAPPATIGAFTARRSSVKHASKVQSKSMVGSKRQSVRTPVSGSAKLEL